MTVEEARNNIGKPFMQVHFRIWDVIRIVHYNGEIEGDKIITDPEDCRLKMEMPKGLKKHLEEKIVAKNPAMDQNDG